ncbi:MAG TPA: hypothetical protein VFK28_07535 [Sphingomicrobium sp.]|nr:hypothetical protein [Sphingomicrobium sp.]
MAGWDQVKWTQARQVAELMELDSSDFGSPETDPESGYRALRERGDMALAVRYIGHALPRLEAVAWAAHLLENWSQATPPGVGERQALDCAIRWVEEPGEEYRRAAQEAARRAEGNSPERLLADAVFMSGGSISEPDLPPVQPPQQACGGLAAAAVIIAAYRTADPNAALAAACDSGEKVAALGAKALMAR